MIIGSSETNIPTVLNQLRPWEFGLDHSNGTVFRGIIDDDNLMFGFDAGKTSAELATLHNRSRAAIEARLLKLGKIDVSALTVQLRYQGAVTPK